MNNLTRSEKIQLLQGIATGAISLRTIKEPLHFTLIRNLNGTWQEIHGNGETLPIENDNPQSYYTALYPNNEVGLHLVILENYSGVSNHDGKPYSPPQDKR